MNRQHFYRGHMKVRTDFICGHEFVGTVEQVGSDVKNFKPGQTVVVPFFSACGLCYFCKQGQSSRCLEGQSFGIPTNDRFVNGGQAEYVRIPNADGTLVLAPETIPREMLVLMADIFPTGYFAARRFLGDLPPEKAKKAVNVVIGCGPVGCCAISSAKYLTRGAKVFAIDMVADRLKEAEKLGAIPLNLGDGTEKITKAIHDATEGRGADVVMEVVGNADALKLALEVLRPFGHISSVGVHTGEFNFKPADVYAKNATVAFGRCPARSLFEESLAALEVVQDQIKFLAGLTMKLEDAVEAYEIFDSKKVGYSFNRISSTRSEFTDTLCRFIKLYSTWDRFSA